MLRANVIVLEALRFFLRQRQDVTCSFCEPVESAKKLRWGRMFSLAYYFPYQLSELIERIVQAGVRLVSCTSRNALPLEVILKIRRRKAVIGTDTIGGEIAFTDQSADRDRSNVQKLGYFLGSHEMFHDDPILPC